MPHGRPHAAPWLTAALLTAASLLFPAPAHAAPEDDDPESLAAGAVVRLTAPAAPGVEAVRITPDLNWFWGEGSPDLRLPADGFRLVATGSLLIQAPGTYRFFIRGDCMAAVLKVNGQVVCEGKDREWSSTPIDSRPGFVAFRLESRPSPDCRLTWLAVDWEGPGFDREPVPARLLFHDPASAPPTDRFEDGRRLADRRGCANCHVIPGLSPHHELGPPLADAVRGADPHWLASWLKDPTSVRPRTRMPAFASSLGDAEIADLIAYLRRLAGKERPITAEVRMAMNVASPEKGRLLFRSVGCLGCHGQGEPAGAGLPVAPDLAGIGRTRTLEAIATYLDHPRRSKVLSPHRPDLRLSADESAHLAAYLTGDERPVVPSEPDPEGDPRRGEALAVRLRCVQCHAVPRLGVTPSLPLRSGTRTDAGCLADVPPAGRSDVPWFAFSAEESAALRAFVAGLPERSRPAAHETRAQDAIRRLNCLGCHARDGQGGGDLAGRLAPLLAQDPALGGLKGTLTPPNLTAVGDKLRPEYLAEAVRGAAPTARPWLSVRMPAFTFEPGEADAIAEALRQHDRMSPGDAPTVPPKPARIDPDTRDVAVRLIGQRGFGCVSCHVLAARVPPGGEPETLGPDLALVHRRMTERYFRRWIADPQRIIAGTPMPQFLKPIEGVPGSLDDQLGALWRLLGSDSLAEAAAAGTREVLKRDGDRALVVRDMVLVPGLPETSYTPRGLSIGLKNDASLLFDTDRLGWLAAWRGGFLSRTKSGRLWEWHPEGSLLWTAAKRLPPVVLVAPDGTVRPPAEVRDRFGTFREVDFVGDGVRLNYRLAFADGTTLDVTETVRPIDQGWERFVEVGPAPPGLRPALVEQPPASPPDGAGATTFTWQAGQDAVTLVLSGATPTPASLPGVPAARVFTLEPTDGGRSAARVGFRAGARR
jgi:mono/diheme cytochrome c family protein